MKRYVALGLVCVALVTIAGCGGPDGHMRELLANLNLYAETIEKKEPPEIQQAALERVRTTLEKIEKLKLSKEDQDKLLKRHDSDLRRVKDRIDTALKNQALEGGAPPPNVLEGLFK